MGRVDREIRIRILSILCLHIVRYPVRRTTNLLSKLLYNQNGELSLDSLISGKIKFFQRKKQFDSRDFFCHRSRLQVHSVHVPGPVQLICPRSEPIIPVEAFFPCVLRLSKDYLVLSYCDTLPLKYRFVNS